MWFWDFAEKSWRYIVLFDNGLIVLPEGDMQTALDILKCKVSFVFDNRFAWPSHWTIGTDITTILFDWKLAFHKINGLPELSRISNEAEVKEMAQNAFIEADKWNKIPEGTMKQTLASNFYEPIEEQKLLTKDFLEDPKLLEPLLKKCCRMQYNSGPSAWISQGEHDITPTEIKEESSKLQIAAFKMQNSVSLTAVKLEGIEWIAPVRFRPPKIKTAWKYIPPQ